MTEATGTTTGIAPPLNEYKVEFLRGRLLRTLLGGVDLLAKGTIPTSVHIFQIVLFLLPAVIGIPVTIIADVIDLESWILACIMGGTSNYVLFLLRIRYYGACYSVMSVLCLKDEKQSIRTGY
jgi:hypothetical protein